MGISLGCLAVLPGGAARADEFAVLPPGDPIYAQLAPLSHSGTAPKTPVSLTRYEAALQAARAILDLQNQDAARASRSDWRAILSLTASLKGELRQLGIDVEATRALATQNLRSNATQIAAKTAEPAFGNSASDHLIFPAAPDASQAKATGSLLLAPQASLELQNPLNTQSRQGAAEFQILPRLRAETALQAVQRTGLDASNPASGFSKPGQSDAGLASVASQTAFSYDLSRFLTLRAAGSKLNWNGAGQAPLLSPLLGAPLFEGASGAAGTGGGVDLNLGGLKLSTEIERLRANTGALANRIGGGASVSAFQNRLLMNMSISRLTPEDKTILPSTAAQLGASLDVTQRLSLSLLYQGLFAPTPSNSAARVSGGVSLSF